MRWIGPAAFSSSSRSATSGAVSSTAACWLAPAHALAYILPSGPCATTWAIVLVACQAQAVMHSIMRG